MCIAVIPVCMTIVTKYNEYDQAVGQHAFFLEKIALAVTFITIVVARST